MSNSPEFEPDDGLENIFEQLSATPIHCAYCQQQINIYQQSGYTTEEVGYRDLQNNLSGRILIYFCNQDHKNLYYTPKNP